MLKTREGFTLIEILVVVAIISVLSAVVVVGLGPARRQGRDARRIMDLKQVQVALELYYNAYGQYPASGILAHSPTGTYYAPDGTCATAIVPPEIDYGQKGGGGWGGLQGRLICAKIGVSAVPDDPAAPSRHYLYDAKDSTVSSYILGVKLDDSNNPILKDSSDLDHDQTVVHTTTVFNCDDPIYCISSD